LKGEAMDKLEKLKAALKKDFNELYVLGYTAIPEIQRAVISVDIDIMDLTHTLKLLEEAK